jgi:hypothetical protein
MGARRLGALTAALIAAASFTGGTAAHAETVIRPDTFTADAQGVGPTLVDAEVAAIDQLYADNFGCGASSLADSYQFPDGSWWADVTADCEG